MDFPLELRFKLVAFSTQVAVHDTTGRLLYYVKQKAFKLKEDVVVYADEAQTEALYRIQADRVFDVSPQYTITDVAGHAVGLVKRRGMRSVWRARYEVASASGDQAFAIEEDNPWVKVVDGLLNEIPFVGLLSGYLFHPAYRVTRAGSGERALLVTKRPAMFEGRFTVETHAALSEEEARLAVLSVVMMVLLERSRG